MGKRTPLEDQTHALYRFYGAGGTLLYIGITNELPRRLGNHHDEKSWWTGVARVEVEHYPTRTAVLEAERRAIIAEKPLYNVQHNGTARTEPQMVVESSALIAICMNCYEPVPPGCGVIHVSPRLATERVRRHGEASTYDDFVDLLLDDGGVHWQVHCDPCNPHYDEEFRELCPDCYAIDTHKVSTWAQLVWWTCHLQGKRWLDGTNWFGFIGKVAEGGDDAFLTIDRTVF